MVSSRRVEWRQAPTESGLSVDRDISQIIIAIITAGKDQLLKVVWDATCSEQWSIQSRKYESIKSSY